MRHQQLHEHVGWYMLLPALNTIPNTTPYSCSSVTALLCDSTIQSIKSIAVCVHTLRLRRSVRAAASSTSSGCSSSGSFAPARNLLLTTNSSSLELEPLASPSESANIRPVSETPVSETPAAVIRIVHVVSTVRYGRVQRRVSECDALYTAATQ